MKPKSPVALGASLAIIGACIMALHAGVVVDVFDVLTWRHNAMSELMPRFLWLSIGAILFAIGTIVSQHGLLRVAAEGWVKLAGRVTIGLAGLSEVVAGGTLIHAMSIVHQRFVEIATAPVGPRSDDVGRLVAEGWAGMTVGLVALVVGPFFWHLCAGEGFRPATSPHALSGSLRGLRRLAVVASLALAITFIGIWWRGRGLDQVLARPMPRIDLIAEHLSAINRLTFLAGTALVVMGIAHSLEAVFLPSERNPGESPGSTLPPPTMG